jgi:hypothetical protein
MPAVDWMSCHSPVLVLSGEIILAELESYSNWEKESLLRKVERLALDSQDTCQNLANEGYAYDRLQ